MRESWHASCIRYSDGDACGRVFVIVRTVWTDSAGREGRRRGETMARRRGGLLSRVGGGAGGVSQLFNIVRELSFDELRDEAQLPPRLLLLGSDRALLAALRDRLGGGAAASFIDVQDIQDPPPGLEGYDGIVLVNAAPADRALPHVKQLLGNAETAARTLTFQLPPVRGRGDDAAPPEEAVADLRRRLVARLAHRQLALGRYLPPFRREVASQLIGATARANTEFALLSNIPAVVPIVGNMMAVGADTLVLTKNQLMLIYKLAAIHGRDIEQPSRLYSEMLPVVGAGVLWRTVARELAAMIPFAAGTIPKLLVAYAGTTATGQAANFYYEQGQRPSREQMKGFYARALEAAKALRLPTRGRDRDAEVLEGRFAEKAPTRQLPSPTTDGRAPAERADDEPLLVESARPAGRRADDEADAPRT